MKVKASIKGSDKMSKNRIKVLIVIQGLVPAGAETQLTLLAPHLNKEIFDVQIAYYYKPVVSHVTQQLQRANIKFTYLDRSKWGRLPYMFKAADFMRREGFDIMHAWHGSANYYGIIPAIMAGVPAVIGGIRGKHGSNIHWLLYSALNVGCQCWTTNAQSIKEMALKKMVLLKDSKVVVVPNGIELNSNDLIKQDRGDRSKARPNRPVIGTVGRLDPVKNHLLFINMAKKLVKSGYDADFWIIGDGAMLSQLRAAAIKSGLENNVKIWGYRSDVVNALSKMDVFVLTSDSEGCPNVLLEAMRASLPVISTNCTSLDEIISEGINGYIVKIGDADALAEKVKLLLSCSKETRQNMGAKSRQTIQERFSLSIATKKFEQIYVKCLKQVMYHHQSIQSKLRALNLV